MSLYNELFPSNPSVAFVQTQWAKDWHAVIGGFEYAADYLTKHRADFGATIDQVGLAIFFLQRHRVEAVLKAMLHGFGAPVPGHHQLLILWKDVEAAARPFGDDEWNLFAADHADLIGALDQVDPSSFSFRYPVRKDGTPVERPPYIDLDSVAKHVGSLDAHAQGYVDYFMT